MQIVAVEARLVRWTMTPRGSARGRSTTREALLVTVRDEDGFTGVGEAAPLPGMSLDAIDDAREAVRALAGRVPLPIDSPGHATAIADRVTGAPAARFAIETALLVALAQRMRTSLASLWGAVPQAELRHAPVVDDPDEARAAVGMGARSLKIKAHAGDRRALAAELERVVEIARAVPGCRLRIDANRTWPRDEVAPALAMLSELPIDYVEEPCPDAHELLDAPLACRIALDESLVHLPPDELAAALRSPGLAALVLKPTLLGGFARCLRLAAAAHRHGVAPVVSHALEGPVGTTACIELARAIGADVAVGLAPHPALEHFAEAL